ncbi:MAG: metal-dependent transcriptional regulator [Bacteroidetes bacterium]|nr:metal-dependent transcriptional regulator [Bacteroidota bacterium]
MNQYSFTEENYLKAIYKLSERDDGKVTTNQIAEIVKTAAASVTDMLQKLSEKKLILYQKYQGVSLTLSGKKIALGVIRKHRLWELFLTSKLGFKWDEVHDIAEQLEHIQSEKLVQNLDRFLGKPKFDPHGDPIPDENGKFQSQKAFPLSDAKKTYTLTITGVIDHHPDFLQYLDKCGLALGKKIKVQGKTGYDNSMNISFLNSKQQLFISFDVAKNILVTL